MSHRAIAKYSYHPLFEDEIELASGDEVTVLEEVENGWLRGRVGQNEGIFPSKYVQDIGEITETTLKAASSSNQAQQSSSM